MKKSLILALALLLCVLLLASCGDSADTTTNTPDTTVATDTTVGEHTHVYAEEPDLSLQVPATCKTVGKNFYHCTVPGCTETKSLRIEKIDHVAIAPATCLAESVCATCGKVIAEKTDHAFGEPVIVKPTCTEKGSKVEVCTVCNFEKKTVLAPEHTFTSTPIAGTDFIKKVCEVCGYSESGIEYTTILKYDFETDSDIVSYLASQGNFSYISDSPSKLDSNPIRSEENGNKYFYVTNNVFVNDADLVLLNTDKYVIEYDIMFPNFPIYQTDYQYNKSIFSILPNGGIDPVTGKYDNSGILWVWLMKVNSTETYATKEEEATINKIPEADGIGKMVVYGGANGYLDKINTGFHFSINKWAHVTFILDWASETFRVYVGDRDDRSTWGNLITNGSLDLLSPEALAKAEEAEGKTFANDREYATRNAFRFNEANVTACWDNFHIYTSTGNLPLWMAD